MAQINAAPAEQRDALLKELNEFASKGCIDIAQVRQDTEELRALSNNDRGRGESRTSDSINDGDADASKINEKKSRVLALITQLRTQLEELERYAYEQGQGELPMRELKQRQVREQPLIIHNYAVNSAGNSYMC